jgi:hypothetical protein
MRHPIPHTCGLPHGILHVFNTILYEYQFQNQTISLFPEQSTLAEDVITL